MRVLAHPLTPDRHRRLDLLWFELGERAHRIGRVHDHLVRPERRRAGEEVGLAAPTGKRVVAAVGLPGGECGVEIGDHAHAPGAVLAQGIELGWGLFLVAGRERVGLAIDRRPRREIEEGARPRAALSGHDHLQPGERVDAQLRAQSGFSIDTCSIPSSTKVGPRSR